MAIVREPGSLVERNPESDLDLPEEERTVFVFKVLSHGQWLRWSRLVASARKNSELLHAAQVLLGMALEDVRNLTVINKAGEHETFELEKRGEEITERAASVLHPFLDKMVTMIEENHTFVGTDAKN